MSAAFGAAIYGCAGPKLTPEERAFFAQSRPFGFILFARNLETPAQIRALCDELRDAAGHAAPIFIDQEGGRVQRLRPPLATAFLPPLEEAQIAGGEAAQAFYLRHRIIAAELMALGIDGNCAPLADIARDATHPVLRNRCYGTDLDSVVRLAWEAARGLSEGGVLPVLKHIPGHGRARLDSHLALPRIAAPEEALRDEDFAAFAQLSDLPLGMTAHLVYEAIDPDRPATQSPRMIELIRRQIGFDGLLMTDDISMEALDGPVAQRARLALAAGCDLVLHCNGELAEMQAIAEVAGTLGTAAQARADRALAARRDPGDVDIEALRAKHEDLLNRQGHDGRAGQF